MKKLVIILLFLWSSSSEAQSATSSLVRACLDPQSANLKVCQNMQVMKGNINQEIKRWQTATGPEFAWAMGLLVETATLGEVRITGHLPISQSQEFVLRPDGKAIASLIWRF